MREPTFSRSRRRARQRRLLRTLGSLVVLIAITAVAVSLLGGEEAPEEEPPTPKVAFAGAFTGYGEKGPSKERVDAEGAAIVALLDQWYQTAFVEVEGFGDGTFPEVAALFAESARASFTEDVDALTIGPAALEVSRVEPEDATAKISIYFEDGVDPTYATAQVAFAATAAMKDEAAFPLSVAQEITLFLEHTGEGWLVSTWYDVTQRQDSIVATASPSPTGGAS